MRYWFFFGAIMVFAGALISPAISRWTAKMAAFGISGGKAEGVVRLFMIHPPLEERIAAQVAGER